MITIPSEVSNLFDAKQKIRCIELVQILAANRPQPFRWATSLVKENRSFDGKRYFAMILELGDLPFKPGFSDDKVKAKINNAGRRIKALADNGVTFERAQVKICLHFPQLDPPNNAIGDWDNPYWMGWVSAAPTYEDVSVIEFTPNYPEMTRDGLRTWEHSCGAMFADDVYCPYNPLWGKGLPANEFPGEIATVSGDKMTLTFTNMDRTSTNYAGRLLYIPSKKLCGRIKSGGSFSVVMQTWNTGESGSAVPAVGDAFYIGEQFSTCAKTVAACKERGMFGPSSHQAESDLNIVPRRFFTGVSNAASYLEDGARIFTSDNVRGSVGGSGNDGRVIPVRVGRFKGPATVLAWGVSGNQRYVHVLSSPGEGRVESIDYALMNGFGSPMASNSKLTTEADRKQHCTFVEGGTLNPNCDDDQAVTDGHLTEHQQIVGAGNREAYLRHYLLTVDTYLGVPYGMMSPSGDGVSLSGISWARTIYDFGADGAAQGSNPSIWIQGTGIKVLKPDGTWQSTMEADPVMFFYYLMRNTLWGAGLPSSFIHEDQVEAMSAICQAFLSPGDSHHAMTWGTITAGPYDYSWTEFEILPGGMKGNENFVVIYGGNLPNARSYAGGILRVKVSGTWIEKEVKELLPASDLEVISQNPNNPELDEYDVTDYWVVFTKTPFSPSAMPSTGDDFELKLEGDYITYSANGTLDRQKRIGRLAEDVLKNCNGTYVMKDGLLAPVIRRHVSPSLITKRVQDYGTGANVIGRIKFKPLPADKIPTRVEVTYIDSTQSGGERVKFNIINEYAEKILQDHHGIDVRNQRTHKLDLCLTGSLEQAYRLGTIYLRENGYIAEIPGWEPGTLHWTTYLPEGVSLQIIEDVVEVDGWHLPNWLQYARIRDKIDKRMKGAMEIVATPYHEYLYGIPPGNMVRDEPVPIGAGHHPTTPRRGKLKIESVTEDHMYDENGNTLIDATMEITLPS